MIEDETYIYLKRLEDSNKTLSSAERTYIEKMESLDYMSGFRPDWYPKKYKKTIIQHLQDEFCKNLNKEQI